MWMTSGYDVCIWKLTAAYSIGGNAGHVTSMLLCLYSQGVLEESQLYDAIDFDITFMT